MTLPPGPWTPKQKQTIEKELTDRIRGRLSGISRQLAGAEVLKREERAVEIYAPTG